MLNALNDFNPTLCYLLYYIRRPTYTPHVVWPCCAHVLVHLALFHASAARLLFADAKVTKDDVENLLKADLAGDAAQLLHGFA